MVQQNQEAIPQESEGERTGEDPALNAAHRAELKGGFIAHCPSSRLRLPHHPYLAKRYKIFFTSCTMMGLISIFFR